MARPRKPPKPPDELAELTGQLQRLGWPADAVEVVSKIAEAHARQQIASLAGTILEGLKKANINRRKPEYRHTGAVELVEALTLAFSDALRKYGEEPG